MAKSPAHKAKPRERTKLPSTTRELLLTECGYRCAVPTCRNILALDMHHIWEVKAGGTDDPSNLIALCPTCHALYHRGTIQADAIFTYKSMLVALSRAFDLDAIDRLLFLGKLDEDFLVVSGDGLLHFSRLAAAGLAVVARKANNNGLLVTYTVNLSDKGRLIIEAWKSGDRTRVKTAMGGPVPGAI